MDPLLSRLSRGEPVLGDGAWGTMLQERGLAPGDPPETVCLSRPRLLTEIAMAYFAAGAEVITTNTFGASEVRLSRHGLSGKCAEVCRQAVAAIREGVGRRALVSGSVGPLGELLAPLGDLSLDVARTAFERQADALATAGVDLVCVETMSDLAEACLAVEAARRKAPGLPVVATMTFEETPRGFFTVMGVPVAKAARRLGEAGADVLGANCGTGSAVAAAIARAFREATALPLSARPNAGLPVSHDGRTVYPEAPRRMAARVPDLLAAGVTLLGGCCGTTPAHVAAMRDAIDAARPRPA
ncbi:hypothetical protein FBQ97_00230 [Acidobacteria bacterium ACD]|nr:MAG: hypothetical protein EDX89_16215 [Acidobacteriota bacterium]MDL1948232.1 hypothetical protein [Acidobacteria bacterium ACD]